MPLLEEILTEYLSKDDLQRIAWDHDLPISRTKGEIAGELLATEDFEADEAVAFMSVPQLRYFCQEHDLPSGAYREALVDRVLGAIQAESHPTPRRRKKARRVSPKEPPPISTLHGEASASLLRPRDVHVRFESAIPTPIEVSVPPPPPPEIRLHVETSKPAPIEVHVPPASPTPLRIQVHPARATAWGFVGIASAAIFGGIYYVTTFLLGVIWGVAVGFLSGITAASLLLVTERKWAPFVEGLVGRPRAPL